MAPELKKMKLPAVNCRVSSGIAPKPTRLRSMSYGAVASPSSLGMELLAKADHPCSPDLSGSTLRSDKLQGILAKANIPYPPLYANPISFMYESIPFTMPEAILLR